MTPEGRKRTSERMKRWHLEHTAPKQGKYYGLSNDRLFRVWQSMINRCNSTEGTYADVDMCDEWREYFTFRNWALSTGYDYAAPRGKCTIDRINPFGNYEPSNCRWTDMYTQQHNKRRDWLKTHPDYQPA